MMRHHDEIDVLGWLELGDGAVSSWTDSFLSGTRQDREIRRVVDHGGFLHLPAKQIS